MTRIDLLHGTWGFKVGRPGIDRPPEWNEPGSAFVAMLARHGFEVRLPTFYWSGDLDGVPWGGKDFEVARVQLAQRAEATPYEDRNYGVHSHAGELLLPVAVDIPIRSIVTFGTPARKEVREAGRIALEKGHIGAWLHVYDRDFDKMGWLGALFDWTFRAKRSMNLPGMTDVGIVGIGHSSILREAREDICEQYGIFDVWHHGAAVAA